MTYNTEAPKELETPAMYVQMPDTDAVQQEEQQEKDRAYKERMNKVYSSLESERAEQKKMDRERAKEKRRSGRK